MEKASLRDILLLHGRRYPLMMPQDAVKLLYQSTFGPGHLIAHKEQARTRLLEEYMLTPSGPPVAWEPIGNGLGRVYLGALYRKIWICFWMPLSARLRNFREKCPCFCNTLPCWRL